MITVWVLSIETDGRHEVHSVYMTEKEADAAADELVRLIREKKITLTITPCNLEGDYECVAE